MMNVENETIHGMTLVGSFLTVSDGGRWRRRWNGHCVEWVCLDKTRGRVSVSQTSQKPVPERTTIHPTDERMVGIGNSGLQGNPEKGKKGWMDGWMERIEREGKERSANTRAQLCSGSHQTGTSKFRCSAPESSAPALLGISDEMMKERKTGEEGTETGEEVRAESPESTQLTARIPHPPSQAKQKKKWKKH